MRVRNYAYLIASVVSFTMIIASVAQFDYVHFRNTFGIEGDYLYRASVQLPTDGAWGDDAFLIADAGLGQILAMDTDGNIEPLPLPAQEYTIVDYHDGVVWTVIGRNILGYQDGMLVYEFLDVGLTVSDISVTDDYVYYADSFDGLVNRIRLEDRQYLSVISMPNVPSLIADDNGLLYVTQLMENTISTIDVETGTIQPFYSNEVFGNSQIYLDIDPVGDIWARGDESLLRLSPEGQPQNYTIGSANVSTGVVSDLQTAGGIAFSNTGELFITSLEGQTWSLTLPEFATDIVYSVIGSGVNTRACAETSCDVVTQLSRGTILDVLEVVEGMVVSGDSTWYKFNFEGQDAFIHASLVNEEGLTRGFLRTITLGLRLSDFAITPDGTVIAYNSADGKVLRFDEEGVSTIYDFENTTGTGALAVDDEDTIYVSHDNVLWRINNEDSISSLATLNIISMDFGSDGFLYASLSGNEKLIVRISTNDGSRTRIHSISDSETVSVDAGSEGTLWVIAQGNRTAEQLSFEGEILQTILLPDVDVSPTINASHASKTDILYVISHANDELRAYNGGRWSMSTSNLIGNPLDMVHDVENSYLFMGDGGAVNRIPVAR